MTQGEMFGHVSPKKRRIKDTQLQAWDWVKEGLGGRHDQLLGLLRQSKKGVTLFEACAFFNLPPNQLSGRFTELAEQGRVVDSGNRRVNPATGVNAVVWKMAKGA